MFLGVVVVVAAIGGRLPALVTAIAAILVVDWYLIPPYRSLAIARGSDAVYLVAFVASAAVDRGRRRARGAAPGRSAARRATRPTS